LSVIPKQSHQGLFVPLPLVFLFINIIISGSFHLPSSWPLLIYLFMLLFLLKIYFLLKGFLTIFHSDLMVSKITQWILRYLVNVLVRRESKLYSFQIQIMIKTLTSDEDRKAQSGVNLLYLGWVMFYWCCILLMILFERSNPFLIRKRVQVTTENTLIHTFNGRTSYLITLLWCLHYKKSISFDYI